MPKDPILFYPKKVMEEVKSANPIADVIKDCIKTKSYGNDTLGLCPFREGDGYTLLISNDKQLYICPECGSSGDVFSFVMEYKKMSLREATEYLAARAEIELPAPRESKIGRKERETTLAINAEAASFYYAQLTRKKDPTGLQYLHERGLSNAIIKRFGLGYASSDPDRLYQHLKAKGYSDKQIERSGLITFYEGSAYDKFRSRAVCPIVDPEKNVVGFSCRIIGDGSPKYKNSPATLAFDKRTILYGLNIAQNTKRNTLVLCEGNMDVISLHQAGFDNAVASLGTALTKDHALVLAKYTNSIHLVYDSDKAGVNATLKALVLLREAGIKADVVHLDPYKDPDDFLKAEGAKAFEDRLTNAESGYAFEIRHVYGHYDLHDEDQKRKMLSEFGKSLIGTTDEEKDEFIKAVQFYIEHYDEVQDHDGFTSSKERTAADTGISVVKLPEDPESDPQESKSNNQADPAAVEPEEKQAHANIDTSWLDDYTIL